MDRRSSLLLVVLLLAAAVSWAGKEYSHQKYFEHYQGTKTCLKCHMKDARAFFRSQHYQWQGEAPQVIDSNGQKLGKINTINDFCTNPMSNWIGEVHNSRGEVLSKGCSKCHAGLGKLPSTEMSREQLENIDCLICHASGYRRDLYPTDDGGWEWRPILWKNQEGMDSVSKRISMPKRSMCLRCHSGSGGGPNFKRGDLEYELADPEREFDVHMSSDGADLTCVDCHAGEDHRVKGRGVDLAGTDMPDARLTCDNDDCHGAAPHDVLVLDRHTERVYCTTCHIPTFAKSDPTDMVRDWSTPKYHEEADKYSATITMGSDVEPVFAWYNGMTHAQLPGKPVVKLPDGSVGMMVPDGSLDDPKAKLYAFKLHRGKMPVLADTGWVVPIQVEEFFADGDIDRAVRHATEVMYGKGDADYEWVDTTRYMGIFHEVQPASEALSCLDCHGRDGRLSWEALGYEEDPLTALMAAAH